MKTAWAKLPDLALPLLPIFFFPAPTAAPPRARAPTSARSIAAPTTEPLVIYDSLLSYADKPDTSKLGLRPIYVADREFFKSDNTTSPDETACRKLGAKIAAMNCPLV